MNTITPSDSLPRRFRRFIRWPLLALLVGLGAAQKVQAQTPTIGRSNVFVNTTGQTTPNLTYGASSGVTPPFHGANLGTYDANTGRLMLNGGTATTFERSRK